MAASSAPAPIAGFKPPGLSRFVDQLGSFSGTDSAHLLLTFLRRNQITGSREVAIAVLSLLSHVIGSSKAQQIDGVVEEVVEVQQILVGARPRDFIISNLGKRVIALIRTEQSEAAAAAAAAAAASTPTPIQDENANLIPDYANVLDGLGSHTAASKVPKQSIQRPVGQTRAKGSSKMIAFGTQRTSMLDLFAPDRRVDGTSTDAPPQGLNSQPFATTLREDILEGLGELQDEVKQADDQIAEYAPQYIHNRATVLIFQRHHSMQRFLLTAAKKAKCCIIYVQTSADPDDGSDNSQARFSEQLPRKSFFEPLRKTGSSITTVSLSSVQPLMKWITHVLAVPSAVFADGSYLAASGSQIILDSAELQRVPILILSGVYKITPQAALDYEDCISSNRSIQGLGQFRGLAEDIKSNMVGEEHIRMSTQTLIVTNIGGYSIAGLSMLIEEHYHLQDSRHRRFFEPTAA